MTNDDQKRLDENSASFTRYYDSMSEVETAEVSEWADISTASLAHTDWPSHVHPVRRLQKY